MNQEQIKEKYLPIGGYVLFLAAGLLIFFSAAFLVVFVRTKSTAKIIVPDLVGKSYPEVHNELGRLQLKVRLETKRYPDQTDGIILYQSIRPGREIEAGSKIVLTVNNGLDRLVVPDVRGQSIDSARANLQKVLSGDTYVDLQIGGITYIEPEGDQLPNTVIDQIPEPGKNATAREKVFLLVTKAPSKTKEEFSPTSFQGASFPLVQKSLTRSGVKSRVEEVVQTRVRSENGLVQSARLEGEEIRFKVYYFEPELSVESGYELFSYEIGDNGDYKAVLKSETKQETDVLTLPVPFKDGEKFQTVFYRKGNVKLTLLDSADSKIKSKSYESEL
ncbi:PASTA domain-containing protein [Leptospira gomenensis]|uniref:PASTA domain-containing protein n=1 Tax=Leptospira gomenensis TaxID=2484974 RepID=A0A5F1YN18_9LEPT|nr:PASTA domain-containing protein [Leptospira gomenensis]TGK35039.1 PASTA domain-containing protein [Leptospira gomenensis]TGK35283.1 PASTA domain-containing protein [Leptospira gomenensis]TGK51768.1 PASTA domain-containing protein [Leptospira gomenensis]TGK58363.1 PASTA domain-containing protein [Leptospira gomenensis]